MTQTHKGKIYLERNCPDIAVDIVLEYGSLEKPGIVLVERKHSPYGRALPGGMVEEWSDLEQNILREVEEETHLKGQVYNPTTPLCVLSDPKRDPRGHIITAAFVGYGTGTILHGSDAINASVFSREAVLQLIGEKRLAFADHGEILQKYFARRDYFDKEKLLGTNEETIAYLEQAWRGFP